MRVISCELPMKPRPEAVLSDKAGYRYMRALVVSCVFPPEPVASSRTSAHIVQGLAAKGHTVTVITSYPSKPAGKNYPGYSRRILERKKTPEGYELIRCYSTLSAKSRLTNRFLENLSFGLTSSIAALFLRRPEVIYANSWPLFATGMLFLVAKIRRIPMVISVQDIYPESLVSQGRSINNEWMMNCLRWWDGVIARGCRAVIVISKRFADHYRMERGVPAARVHIVPNWGDDPLESACEDRVSQFRARIGIPPSARIFAYGGNIGVAAGVETLIQAALKIKMPLNFRLLIAGEGSQLQACRELVRDHDDSQVIFHSPWKSEETSLVLGLAEVLLLPTRGKQSTVSVPSKLISYWLAGRPVIAMARPQSDLADLIEESGGGWLVAPDRADLLSDKIQEVLRLNPAELRRRGEAGRDFAVRNLTRNICLPGVVRILEQAAAR